MEEICVCCGDIVPEGRMICLRCEEQVLTEDVDLISTERSGADEERNYNIL